MGGNKVFIFVIRSMSFRWFLESIRLISYSYRIFVLWPRKGPRMETQTRILDNRLYYTRKIELHRKDKKSRTVRITPIFIYGIWCPPHPTGMCGTRPFLVGPGTGPEPTNSWHFQKLPTAPSAFSLLGVTQAPGNNPPPKGVKAWGKAPWGRRKSPGTETHSARSMPQITRPAEVLPGNWGGSERYWSAVFDARLT